MKNKHIKNPSSPQLMPALPTESHGISYSLDAARMVFPIVNQILPPEEDDWDGVRVVHHPGVAVTILFDDGAQITLWETLPAWAAPRVSACPGLGNATN